MVGARDARTMHAILYTGLLTCSLLTVQAVL
jgi:hypothetical protein